MWWRESGGLSGGASPVVHSMEHREDLEVLAEVSEYEAKLAAALDKVGAEARARLGGALRHLGKAGRREGAASENSAEN